MRKKGRDVGVAVPPGLHRQEGRVVRHGPLVLGYWQSPDAILGDRVLKA